MKETITEASKSQPYTFFIIRCHSYIEWSIPKSIVMFFCLTQVQIGQQKLSLVCCCREYFQFSFCTQNQLVIKVIPAHTIFGVTFLCKATFSVWLSFPQLASLSKIPQQVYLNSVHIQHSSCLSQLVSLFLSYELVHGDPDCSKIG
jgi:hypothetical protein